MPPRRPSASTPARSAATTRCRRSRSTSCWCAWRSAGPHRGAAEGRRPVRLRPRRRRGGDARRLRRPVRGGAGRHRRLRRGRVRRDTRSPTADYAQRLRVRRRLPQGRQHRSRLGRSGAAAPDRGHLHGPAWTAACSADRLIAHGLPGDTPAAIVQQGTTPQQRVVTGTLATLPALAEAAQLKPPTLIIIGRRGATAGEAGLVRGRLTRRVDRIPALTAGTTPCPLRSACGPG
ncbi:MAG: hypothetical protein MZW92_79020 [Comamonadaceae bacterium]|nr:hypothetical protein [Comamonadaceae bacterium]